MKKINARKVALLLGVLFIVGLVAATVYSRGFAERQKPYVHITMAEPRILVWSYEARGIVEAAEGRVQEEFEWVITVTVPREAYMFYMSEFMFVSGWPAEVTLDLAGWPWPCAVVRRQDFDGDVELTFAFDGLDLRGVDFTATGGTVLMSFEMDNMPSTVPAWAVNHDIFTNEYYIYLVSRRDGIWGREFVAHRHNVIFGMPRMVGDVINLWGGGGTDFNLPVVTWSDRPLYDGTLVRLFD